MHEADFFGFCFYFFIFAGMWFLRMKDKFGWLCRFAGEAGWVGIGLWIGMYSIWIPGLIFMAMDLYGYRAWKQQEEFEIQAALDFVMDDSWDDKLIHSNPAFTKFGEIYDPTSQDFCDSLRRVMHCDSSLWGDFG